MLHVLSWPYQDRDLITEVSRDWDPDSREEIEAEKLPLNRLRDHDDEAWEKVNKAFPEHLAALDSAVSNMYAQQARLVVRLGSDDLVSTYRHVLDDVASKRTLIGYTGTTTLRTNVEAYNEALRTLREHIDTRLELIGAAAQRLVAATG